MKKDIPRIIAGVQIAGGIWGFIGVLYYRHTPLFANILSVDALLVAPFVLAIYAGYHLWRGHKLGHTLSLITQALQIPILGGPAICYYYYVLVYLGIGWFPPNSIINLQFGGGWLVTLHGVDQPVAFGINVVALVAFILLLKTESERPNASAQILERTQDPGGEHLPLT